MLVMIYAHIIVTPTLNDIGLGLTYANRLPICGLIAIHFSQYHVFVIYVV